MRDYRSLKCAHCGRTSSSSNLGKEETIFVCQYCKEKTDLEIAERKAREDIW